MKKPKKIQTRNHVALALLNRGGASKCHGQSHKARRMQDKAADRRGFQL